MAEKQPKEGNILYNAIMKIVRSNYYWITINAIVPFNDFLQCRDFNTFLESTVNHYSLKKFLKCFKNYERELPLREATVDACCFGSSNRY